MSTWNGFPKEIRFWTRFFEKTYDKIDKVLGKIVWCRFKCELISYELSSFLKKLSSQTGTITSDQILRLFEFLKACTSFIGILSHFLPNNWLSYLIHNSLNKSYVDLAFLWNAWAETSTAFCFECFQTFDGLSYAHSRDLVQTRDLLVSRFQVIPTNFQKRVYFKISQINSVLSVQKGNQGLFESNNSILKHRDWIIVKENIGQGAYAVVHYAKHRVTGEELAIKELKPNQLKPRTVGYLKREIDSMLHLDHPNLLKLVGVTVTQPFCIATTYIPNGNLFDILHDPKVKSTPLLKSQIAVDIVRGLEYLHANHMVHRDLKPPNILMDKNNRAVICDFGLARIIGPNMSVELGTIQWMAPELLQPGHPYGGCVDVFAVGILLWELYTGKMPFRNYRIMQIAVGVVMHELRPEFPPDSDPEYSDLIQRCWAQEMHDRPTMKEVRLQLEKGNCVVPGTNKEEFLKWIQDTAPEHQKIMDEYYTKKQDPQVVISKLKSMSPLDPQASLTLEQLLELNILDDSILDDLIALAKQTTSPPLQERAIKVIAKIIDVKTVNPDKCAFSLLNIWDVLTDFVVSSVSKLAPNMKNLGEFLEKLLSRSQPNQTIDLIDRIAQENHIEMVLESSSHSIIVPVLSVFLKRFGARKIMLKASVSSLSSIVMFLSSILREEKYSIIGLQSTPQSKVNLSTTIQMLSSNSYRSSEKDATFVMMMLVPYLMESGPGKGSLEFLNNVLAFATVHKYIIEKGLTNILFSAFTSQNIGIVKFAISIIQRVTIPDEIMIKNWDIIVSCYSSTQSRDTLKFIQSILNKYEGLEISSFIASIFLNIGKEIHSNSFLIQVLLELETSKHKFILDDSFSSILTQQIQNSDYNVPACLAILILKHINSCGFSKVTKDMLTSTLVFLYNRKPPLEAAAPFLQILLAGMKLAKIHSFLIQNDFVLYLHQLAIIYPADPRVLSIIEEFSTEFKNHTKK